MASRTVWKGFIQFSLVSVPVKAYTATASGGGKISLNQLHQDCHSRIKYAKTCPVHGEIPASEIVSGYEFADGKYVVVEPDELEKLRTPREKALNIEGFVAAEAVDARYFNGKSWYLAPDGPVGQKAYQLLRRSMTEGNRTALAHVSLSGRKQLVLLRPLGDLLVASFLSYETELKKPSEFTPEVTTVEVNPKELQLAKTLTDSLMIQDLDLSAYTDDYQEKLGQLIQMKVEGQAVVEPPAAEEAPMVINLMEALQRSLESAKATTKPAAAKGKPPKLAAPASAETRAAGASRKRKSS